MIIRVVDGNFTVLLLLKRRVASACVSVAKRNLAIINHTGVAVTYLDLQLSRKVAVSHVGLLEAGIEQGKRLKDLRAGRYRPKTI